MKATPKDKIKKIKLYRQIGSLLIVIGFVMAVGESIHNFAQGIVKNENNYFTMLTEAILVIGVWCILTSIDKASVLFMDMIDEE